MIQRGGGLTFLPDTLHRAKTHIRTPGPHPLPVVTVLLPDNSPPLTELLAFKGTPLPPTGQSITNGLMEAFTSFF